MQTNGCDEVTIRRGDAAYREHEGLSPAPYYLVTATATHGDQLIELSMEVMTLSEATSLAHLWLTRMKFAVTPGAPETLEDAVGELTGVIKSINTRSRRTKLSS